MKKFISKITLLLLFINLTSLSQIHQEDIAMRTYLELNHSKQFQNDEICNSENLSKSIIKVNSNDQYLLSEKYYWDLQNFNQRF